MMKCCPRCFKLFEALDVSAESPMEELADMLPISSGGANTEDLCPQCKEELGMMTLLGFGK